MRERSQPLFEASQESRQAYKQGVNGTFKAVDRIELKAVLDARRSVDDLKNRILVRLHDVGPITVFNLETTLNPILNELLYDWADDLQFKHGGLFQTQAMTLGIDLVDHVLQLLGVVGPTRPSLRDMQDSLGRSTTSNSRSWIYKAVVQSWRDIRDTAQQAVAAGKSVDQVLRRKELWDRVNSRAARAVKTWQAEAVARATDRRLTQLAGTIPNLKKQFLTGGVNPCAECRSFATRTFDIVGGSRGPHLPLHPFCVCTYHPFILGVTPSVSQTPRAGEVQFADEENQ